MKYKVEGHALTHSHQKTVARLGRFVEAQQANEAAQQHTDDENLLQSLAERAEKIRAGMREVEQ